MIRRYLHHVIALLILAGIGIANLNLNFAYTNDPDRYYHFAISRQMKETGKLYVREIPQIKGIHWDEYFPDKEFLFHQFTGLGYRIGGENGALVIIWLLALTTVFLLYLLAASRMAWWLALCLTASLCGWGYLISRICLFRPQVPAILFFTVLLHGIHQRSRWLCMFATALMALSYHGVFIPFTPIVIAGISFFLFPENKLNERKIVAWSLLGLVVGVLINPYFPSNLLLGWIHAQIPFLMKNDLSGVVFGAELYPFSTSIFKEAFTLPILILFLAVFSLHKTIENRKLKQDLVLFTLTAGAFFLMATESPRAAEYWIPTSVFLSSILYTIWQTKEKYSKALIILSLSFLVNYYQRAIHFRPVESSAMMEKLALDKIGTEKKHAFIFNYEWDATPYILYFRPDLSFVDILDPSLLYFTNRVNFWARQKLLNLQTGDSYAIQKNTFKADYSMTKSVAIADVLRRDPDFFEIYPGSQKQTVPFFVFQLRDSPSPNFLHQFSVSSISKISGANFREKTPADADDDAVKHTEDKTAYLDLAALFQTDFPKVNLRKEINCARVDLDPNEIKKFVGAEYIVLGGGDGLLFSEDRLNP